MFILLCSTYLWSLLFKLLMAFLSIVQEENGSKSDIANAALGELFLSGAYRERAGRIVGLGLSSSFTWNSSLQIHTS